jgi:predicted acetyltransferase
MAEVRLVVPGRELLASYVAALETGWSPDNLRPQVAQEHLAEIARDADAFLAGMIDREARGGPVTLPDGSQVPRLPGYRLWITDGEFCGSIGLRWVPGTTELPPHVLGHIGYAVVPWKRNRGYATRALALMLREARKEGLDHVIITTDRDNMASRRVIEANGARRGEPFTRGTAYGHSKGLRYRVPTPKLEEA